MTTTQQRSKWPEPTVEEPTLGQLEEWADDCICESTDGIMVEPDGVDENGYPSWLLYLGLI